MPLPSQIEIDQIKSQLGVTLLRSFELAGVEVVCRAPSEADYKRFKTQVADSDRRATAPDALVYACVVWPGREEFRDMVKVKPGIIESIAGELVEWAGATKLIEKKDM